MTTIDHVAHFVAPAAYALLPPALASPAATAFVLAIGLQESRFLARRQIRGPARGFWQFEPGGVAGVLAHASTAALADRAVFTLCYAALRVDVPGLCEALADNDVLAFVFARLLLATIPDPLPRRGDTEIAWEQYGRTWRPGIPRRVSWDDCCHTAWEIVAPRLS